MIYGERVSQAEEILVNFLRERQIKVSYPMAISIVSSGMGVREETGRKYLDGILLHSKRIKTNYWEVWLEEV